jgi:hypothetical protein
VAARCSPDTDRCPPGPDDGGKHDIVVMDDFIFGEPRPLLDCVVIRTVFRRRPDIEATAEPERLRSNFIRGIKRLPVAFRPA